MAETMTDLSKTLRELAADAKGPWLSIPGDPAWLNERDEKKAIETGITNLLRNNLPTILTALELQERVNAAGGYMLTQGNPLMPQSGSAATLKGDQ